MTYNEFDSSGERFEQREQMFGQHGFEQMVDQLADGSVSWHLRSSTLHPAMTFHVLLALAALAAGAIASLSGFGIGSVLTPLLALHLGTKLAVAAVSFPHALGTALRLWLTREHVDGRVLLSFGVTSAVGGLAGALLHTYFKSAVLTYVLAALLIFTGVMGITGLAQRMRFGRRSGWVAGALSGVFGGLVGNQGGIRAAAMLGFDIPKEAFVATATAIALLVDGARMPVYLVTEGAALLRVWMFVLVAALGVISGTIAGRALLGRIPEPVFRRLVSAIILALGVAMLFLPQR